MIDAHGSHATMAAEIANLRDRVRRMEAVRDRLAGMVALINERVRMGVMTCPDCDGHNEHTENCPWGEYADH